MSKLERLIQQYCPDGVEWKKIEELCKTKTPPCKLKTNEYQEYGVYPIIDQGQKPIAGYTDNEDALVDDGEYILYGDHTCIVKYHNGCFAQGADGLKILISPNNNSKYVYYAFCAYNLLSTEYKRHWTQAKEIEIPVPPLPVQEEIVRILDAFTELQAELQAELQKRQQQYNFYRDNLLTNFTEEQNVKEYSLGELGTFTRGNGLQKKDFTKEGVGCIHYGQIYTRFGAFADKTLTYVNKELASRLLQVEKGNLVIACTSENVEDICKSVAWLGEENICTGGHACVFKHNQNPKYISYFFQTEYFFNQKKKYTYGTKVKDIKPDSIAKIKISLPSLKEQERIVSILDNLYTLTNDLTSGLPAEMEKRRQQYEYYRDRLLTFKRL